MKQLILPALLFLPVYLWGLTDAEFHEVESLVFSAEDVDELSELPTGNEGIISRFQTALIYYRMGNLQTNKNKIEESIDILEELNEEMENVYIISYLGIAYATEAGMRGIFGAIGSGSRSLRTLNEAVEKYPNHYLPRFSRGMLLLFMPGILGGDEDQGIEDMEFVVEALPSVDRDDGYKAFVYFIYGVYWGEKAGDFAQAAYYLETAIPLIDENETEFIVRAEELLENYRSNL